MKAMFNGEVIAASDETVVVEGNHYFPADSVRPEFLAPSDMSTTCHWKGIASYHDVVVEGQVAPAGAWRYEDPKPRAERLRGLVAFWRGVEVVD